MLDDFLASGTQATEQTKYIYRLVIEGKLQPYFGKIRASKTTQRTKDYRKQRTAELLGRKLKACPNPTREQHQEWERSAGATANRELARLRTALEYGKSKRRPRSSTSLISTWSPERDNVRKVVLANSDYATLRDSIRDQGVRLLYIVSSHVGIRAAELKRVMWDQVDLERRVIRLERGRTKNKEPRSAPIFGDMVDALAAAKRHRDEFYPDSLWVFSRAGKPIKDVRDEWSRAVAAAGAPDLHFHDLRRTAQRLMRRAGIDKITRMRIMGHKTDALNIRYGVVEDDDIVEAGSKLEVTFQSAMGGRNGRTGGEPPAAGVASELLAKLSTLPEEKLKAMAALLGV